MRDAFHSAVSSIHSLYPRTRLPWVWLIATVRIGFNAYPKVGDLVDASTANINRLKSESHKKEF